MPRTLTELHCHLWSCAIDYRSAKVVFFNKMSILAEKLLINERKYPILNVQKLGRWTNYEYNYQGCLYLVKSHLLLLLQTPLLTNASIVDSRIV